MLARCRRPLDLDLDSNCQSPVDIAAMDRVVVVIDAFLPRNSLHASTVDATEILSVRLSVTLALSFETVKRIEVAFVTEAIPVSSNAIC